MKESFTIGNPIRRIPKEKIDRVRDFGACIVADAMQGFCSMDTRIRPMVPGSIACGQAITVQLRPGDKLMLHRAIEIAEQGDIIVVSCGGDFNHAAFGGNMAEAAFRKGVGGVIIDGAVRDVEELKSHGYAVFAAAITAKTGDNDRPGRLNQPISCGDVPVYSGDVVIGDDNGVSVVPAEWIDLILINCEKKQAADLARAREIEEGLLIPNGIQDRLSIFGYRE